MNMEKEKTQSANAAVIAKRHEKLRQRFENGNKKNTRK